MENASEPAAAAVGGGEGEGGWEAEETWMTRHAPPGRTVKFTS